MYTLQPRFGYIYHRRLGQQPYITFRAEGTSRDGEPVVREATRSKYVEGRIAIDPDPGKPQQAQEECCRWLKMLLAACGFILLGIFIVLLMRL